MSLKGTSYRKMMTAAALAAMLLSLGSCSIFRSRKSVPTSTSDGKGGYTYSYDPSWGRGGGVSTARPVSDRENPFRKPSYDTDTLKIGRKEKSRPDNDLLTYAKSFIGTPYKYGSSGPNSFDCSGFTYHVFSKFGITLERSSRDQAKNGKQIRSKEDLEPGDLVFFARNGNVFHVGIVLEKTGDTTFNFIHSSTSVGVTVTSSESSYWKGKYYSARRMN